LWIVPGSLTCFASVQEAVAGKVKTPTQQEWAVVAQEAC